MADFGEIGERLRRSTVQVLVGDAGEGSGSGVIWDAEGLIVTNAHVARTRELAVGLFDGRRLPAQVTSRDSRRDLAALRISATELPAAAAGDSTALRPGELAIAVGNPLGFAGALSTGVIHSTGTLPGMGTQKWIRATVRLAPGNSGGPLANAAGEVVGINTAIVRGLGVAVPSAAVETFLRRGGTPHLGVVLRPVHSFGGLGLLLLEVEPDGPAALASLRAGDILVGVNGRRIESFDSLGDALDSGLLRLQFLRGDPGRIRETSVRPAVRAGAA